MRRLALFIFFVIITLLGGCLSPGTIKPLADQNLQNIQNLVANNAILYESYGKLIKSTGKVELQRRLALVSLRLSEFTSPSGVPDSSKLTTEVGKLQPLVDHNKGIMTTEDFEKFRRTIATEKPIIGDIAAGFISQEYVEKVIPANYHLFHNQVLNEQIKVASAEPFLREFFYVKSWQQALDDTLSAVGKFLSIVREQESIAESQAHAFKAFSQSNANFADIAIGITSNTDIQTSIVDLIAMTTKDPNRKAEAEKLLKTLTNP